MSHEANLRAFLEELPETKHNGTDVFDQYRYVGNSEDPRDEIIHRKFWGDPPPHEDDCPCKYEGLKKNCWIRHVSGVGNTYVVGSVCIKKFLKLENRKKICEACGDNGGRKSGDRCLCPK